MGARREPATPIGWLSWRKKCVSFAGRTRSCDRPRFFRSGARPPTEMIVTFIDQHKHEFGAEPVCRTLTAAGTQIAPSTYHAFTSRPPLKRALRDEELLVDIRRVHAKDFGVYGAKKLHAQLRREGVGVARCTVDSRHTCYSDDGVSTHQRRRSVHLVRLVPRAR